MGFLIFRGVGTEGSESIVGSGNVLTGVAVSKMPDHKKASKRTTDYYVKGRDGVLHIDEGFDNYDIKATLVLLNASASARWLVNAWADGTGKLISSDDLTKAYKASVFDEVAWKRYPGNDGGFFDTATITFNCEPFLYEASDSVIILTQTQSIINPGSADAFPLIKVLSIADGTVEMNISGTGIAIDNMVAGVPVFIDCANGYVYSSDGAGKEMRGNIPMFNLGENHIVLGTNLASLTITPHWRWV